MRQYKGGIIMARKKKKIEEEIITNNKEEIIDISKPKNSNIIFKVKTSKTQPIKKSTIKKYKAQNLSDFLY